MLVSKLVPILVPFPYTCKYYPQHKNTPEHAAQNLGQFMRILERAAAAAAYVLVARLLPTQKSLHVSLNPWACIRLPTTIGATNQNNCRTQP
jgi:hypothetical protein